MFMTVEFWFLIGAALVFWMQAGFAMVEAGFTRAKNAGNIIMKNLMDFCIGTVVFALLGYTIMMGEDTLFGLIGIPNMDLFAHFKEFIASPANGDFTAASTFVFNLGSALDLGRRLAFPAWFSRLRRLLRNPHGRRYSGFGRRGHLRTPSW